MNLPPHLHQFFGTNTGVCSLGSLRTRQDNHLPIFFSQLQKVDVNGRRYLSHGHGAEKNVSQVSCVGEFLERLGALNEPVFSQKIYGSIKNLKSSHHFLPIEYYHNFTQQQIAEHKGIHNIKVDESCVWIEGQLKTPTENKSILFPFSSVSMHMNDHPYTGPLNTSGMALSTSEESSELLSAMEAAERSVFLRHWWFKSAPPRISVESISRLNLHQSVTDLLTLLGRRLKVLDLTQDAGLPTICCAIFGEKTKSEPALVIGSSCKTSTHEALTKALMEAFHAFSDLSKQLKTTESGVKNSCWDDIKGPFQRRYFHSDYSNLKVSSFLFEGQIKNDFNFLSIDPSTAMERLVNRLGKLVTFDLTPLDLSMGGLYLTRTILPDEIPLDTVHALRPVGCKALRDFPGVLNNNPHPLG